MAQILLIEPNQTIAATTMRYLSEGHTVMVAPSAKEAIERADLHRPDIVITELSLRGHSGFEFMYEFRTYHDWLTIPVIVYSTVRVSEVVRASRTWQQLGIVGYLYKPTHDLSALLRMVDRHTAQVDSP